MPVAKEGEEGVAFLVRLGPLVVGHTDGGVLDEMLRAILEEHECTIGLGVDDQSTMEAIGMRAGRHGGVYRGAS